MRIAPGKRHTMYCYCSTRSVGSFSLMLSREYYGKIKNTDTGLQKIKKQGFGSPAFAITNEQLLLLRDQTDNGFRSLRFR